MISHALFHRLVLLFYAHHCSCCRCTGQRRNTGRRCKRHIRCIDRLLRRQDLNVGGIRKRYVAAGRCTACASATTSTAGDPRAVYGSAAGTSTTCNTADVPAAVAVPAAVIAVAAMIAVPTAVIAMAAMIAVVIMTSVAAMPISALVTLMAHMAFMARTMAAGAVGTMRTV